VRESWSSRAYSGTTSSSAFRYFGSGLIAAQWIGVKPSHPFGFFLTETFLNLSKSLPSVRRAWWWRTLNPKPPRLFGPSQSKYVLEMIIWINLLNEETNDVMSELDMAFEEAFDDA